VEESPRTLSLQDLADPHDLDMQKGLRRMHLHAHRMLLDAERALAGPLDASTAAELEASEGELDRLWLLLLKQHNMLVRDVSFGKRNGVTAEDSTAFVLVARDLERAGDYANRIAAAAAQVRAAGCGPEAVARLRSALREAARLLDAAMGAVQRRDAAIGNRTVVEVGALLATTRGGLLAVMAGPEGCGRAPTEPMSLGCWTALESIERVALYAKSIAEVAINVAMATGQPERADAARAG